MKILYIGNFEPQWSTEQDVKAAFEHDNHKVIAVQENKIKEYLHLIKRYDYDLLLITGTWADSITLEDCLVAYGKENKEALIRSGLGVVVSGFEG